MHLDPTAPDFQPQTAQKYSFTNKANYIYTVRGPQRQHSTINLKDVMPQEYWYKLRLTLKACPSTKETMICRPVFWNASPRAKRVGSKTAWTPTVTKAHRMMSCSRDAQNSPHYMTGHGFRGWQVHHSDSDEENKVNRSEAARWNVVSSNKVSIVKDGSAWSQRPGSFLPTQAGAHALQE